MTRWAIELYDKDLNLIHVNSIEGVGKMVQASWRIIKSMYMKKKVRYFWLRIEV